MPKDKQPPKYSGLIESINQLSPTNDDHITCEFLDGVARFRIQRPNGEVLTQTKYFDSDYVEYTQFNGNKDISRRQEIVDKMHNTGLTQREIGERLGVSQATVSNDIRRKNNSLIIDSATTFPKKKNNKKDT